MRVLARAPFQFLRGRDKQCNPLVMETMPGQRGRRIGFPNDKEAVAVAQESEFLAVNQKIRVRFPVVTLFR